MNAVAPDIGILQPMSSEMTREERNQEVLFKLRDNLVKKFEQGLEPLNAFKQCLLAKHKGEELKKVSFNDQEVECQKIIDVLMAKVIMNLPLLRQHQILGHTPAMINWVQDDLEFKRRFERTYPDANYSDRQIREMGTSISLEHIKLPVGSSPPPTLSELEDAAQIRRAQFKYRDQQFFEANHNKEPYKRCIVWKKREEGLRLEFIPIVDNHSRATKCGKIHVRDETQIVGSVNLNQDELNMDDAYPREAYRAMLSYRSKIVLDHKIAVKSMVEADPFLAHLNLSTDDLPFESDDEKTQENKQNKIYDSLLKSFALMEQQATGELQKVKEETNLKELRAIIMDNPLLVEESIQNQPNLDKRTCDTLQSLYEVQKLSRRRSKALRITASSIGGISCPFTWGAGCLLAVAAHIPHVNDLNKRKNLALAEFFSGQSSIDDYIALEKEHSFSKVLLGMELVGFPVLGPGKLLLKSFNEASLISRAGKSGARKTSEALIENVPRNLFGKDVAKALQASRAQGNVEFYTLHGMASSHAAIRVGDEELALIRAKAEKLNEAGQAYSLFRSNCSQTVCDLVTHSGTRTVDVERTFDPLMLRQRLNNSLGDRAVAQNIYGNEARLGASSRRRYIMTNAAYAIGMVHGNNFMEYYPKD
jgi:hypothetical protein